MKRALPIVIAVALVATVLLCVFLAPPPLYMDRATSYLPLFRRYAARYGLDICLLLAIANAESAFDAAATSSAGAVGLMQLMPSTAEWVAARNGWEYREQELFEAEYNLAIACSYIVYLRGKFRDEWVLAAYNAGEGVVGEWLREGRTAENIPYRETRDYVAKVRKLSKRYCQRGVCG